MSGFYTACRGVDECRLLCLYQPCSLSNEPDGPGILPRFQKRSFVKMTNHPKKDLSNELAKERSRQASDRTLMAWVRTSLSLIGFGFAIANFRAILLNAGLVSNPREHANVALVFGLSFIALGILGLVVATLQHWNILQHLKQADFSYTGFRPLAFIMAILLMLIGLFAFIAVLV
jgi:putative membrane protein